MDIVFLHDLHSHLENFPSVEDGKTVYLGGMPQMKVIINEKKSENPDALVLDAGDFSMGTLIQTVYASEAAELKLLWVIMNLIIRQVDLQV